MLPNGWTELVALVAAFLISALTTPAGISGAVLLLPFQVRVLGTPGPSVTPTNLLYNVVSTPGALYRYWRQGQTGGRLALVLIAGTVPRRHRRIGHPGRAAPGSARVRPGGRRRPAWTCESISSPASARTGSTS